MRAFGKEKWTSYTCDKEVPCTDSVSMIDSHFCYYLLPVSKKTYSDSDLWFVVICVGWFCTNFGDTEYPLLFTGFSAGLFNSCFWSKEMKS